MRHSCLYALLLTFLTACNATDYRHAVELRFSEDEPADSASAFGESDGVGVAYTVYRRDTDEGLPIGFEFGIGEQSDGATHGELNHAWIGAFREFGESAVRPFVGVGVINTELVRDNGTDPSEVGPYAQIGLRVYLTPAYHMAIGYRESFGIEDSVDREDFDLATSQIFFSLGFGF